MKPILLINSDGSKYRSKVEAFPHAWSADTPMIVQVDSPFGIYIRSDGWETLDDIAYRLYFQAPVVKQGKRVQL